MIVTIKEKNSTLFEAATLFCMGGGGGGGGGTVTIAPVWPTWLTGR